MACDHGCVLITAPPESGKTSLLQLLLNHAEEQGMVGCYLNCAANVFTKWSDDAGCRVDVTLDQALAKEAGGTLEQLMNRELGVGCAIAKNCCRAETAVCCRLQT